MCRGGRGFAEFPTVFALSPSALTDVRTRPHRDHMSITPHSGERRQSHTGEVTAGGGATAPTHTLQKHKGSVCPRCSFPLSDLHLLQLSCQSSCWQTGRVPVWTSELSGNQQVVKDQVRSPGPPQTVQVRTSVCVWMLWSCRCLRGGRRSKVIRGLMGHPPHPPALPVGGE